MRKQPYHLNQALFGLIIALIALLIMYIKEKLWH